MRTLATNPLNLLVICTLLLLTERCINAAFLRVSSPVELQHLWASITFIWITMVSACLIVFLIGVHLPYQTLARSITDAWLETDDVIVVCDRTDPDDEGKVLGMLLLEYHVRESQVSKCKKRRTGRGLIRGWAVAPSAQRSGVGAALLAEAARVVSSRGGEGVWFAEEHAHSERVLPAFYSGVFDKRDRAAQRRLASVAEETFKTGPGGRRRAYSGRC